MTKKSQAEKDSTIAPTVGRDVLFTPATDDTISRHGDQPLAAKIAYVHDDGTVNLAVFDAKGNSTARTSVPLVQGDADRPEAFFAEWPPA